MLPFTRQSIALGAVTGLIALSAADPVKALIINGGGTFNVTNQITGNNKDIALCDGTLNLNPGGVIGSSLI
jgi:hypothetical protein